MKKIIIAFGGNAISDPSKKEPVNLQIRKIEHAVSQLKPLVKRYQLIITHGNGSEIGNLLIQQEKSKDILTKMPLDTLDAMTQGQIGYWVQQAIKNILQKNAVSVVTQILVDKKDPAFKKPTKPIGPYYSKKIFRNMIRELDGWRRVVPSPKPKKIIEIEGIKNLIKKGMIVIACGGGGIPVILKKGKLTGIEAVIDKDYASENLATALKAEVLFILTDIDYVYLNYGKKKQKALRKITVKEAIKYLKQGHFKEGSMKPKIEASIEFLKNGGKKVIISKILSLEKALSGKTGTTITRY